MSALSIHSLWGLRLRRSPLGDDVPAGGEARDHGEGVAGSDERDLLVNRLIEGRATPGDWLDLRDSVTADPALWEHLSATQGDAGALCTAVGGQMVLAERVALPERSGETGFGGGGGFGRSVSAGWTKWGGWAVAAAVGLAFVGVQGLGWVSGRGMIGPSGQAGLSSSLGLGSGAGSLGMDYQDALDRYVQMGQEAGSVLGELPHRVVVSTQPTEDGRIEVVYIRQLLERTIVDNAFRLGTDETGRPRLVPSAPSAGPGGGEGGSPL